MQGVLLKTTSDIIQTEGQEQKRITGPQEGFKQSMNLQVKKNSPLQEHKVNILFFLFLVIDKTIS